MRTFPLQTSRKPSTLPGPLSIPWSVAEVAYGEYARRYGTSQSLERLAERGGFGWCEMDEFHPKWREEVSEIEQLRRQLAAVIGLLQRRLQPPGSPPPGGPVELAEWITAEARKKLDALTGDPDGIHV